MSLDLKRTFEIAVEVRGRQRDKAGEPHLFHVMRVVFLSHPQIQLFAR